MVELQLIGIVNRRLGMLDLFCEPEESNSVALPLDLAVSDDPERITRWAVEEGLIRQGQCVAISDL